MIKSYEVIELFDDNYVEFDFDKEDYLKLKQVYENYKKSLLRFMDAMLKDKYSYLSFSDLITFTKQYNEEIIKYKLLYIHIVNKREFIHICWDNIAFAGGKYFINMLKDLMRIKVNNDIGGEKYA